MRCLNEWFVFGSWGLTALVLHGWAEISREVPAPVASGLWRAARVTLREWREGPADLRWMNGFIVVWFGGLGLLALCAAPSNQDALSYHLPRVMHWLQQGNVAHFVTDDTREVEFGPWAGFVQMHLFLLGGNDRLVNLPQWFAMISSSLAASWIARQLFDSVTLPGQKQSADFHRQTRRVEAFAALLTATIPIGIVESFTPQNDYLTTAWMLMAGALALAWKAQPSRTGWALGLGLALGLGTLTKSSMYLYAGPLVIAVGFWLLRHCRPWRRLAQRALLVSSAFILLNLPHAWRNYSVFGSPFGSAEMLQSLRNAEVSLAGTCANVIRNSALHTPSEIEPLSRGLNAGLSHLYRLTRRELNDPSTTYHAGQFRWHNELVVYDSHASCFWHLLLGGVAGVLLWCNPSARQMILYALIPATGFGLFCALLRWQEWHTRVHLAWIALLVPLIAVALVTSRKTWPTPLAAAFVAVFGFICLLRNQSVPVLNPAYWQATRAQQCQSPFYSAYQPAVADLLAAKARRLGMKLRPHDTEYLLWIMLRGRGFSGTLWHVGVENETAVLAQNSPGMGAIITTMPGRVPAALTNQFPVQSFHQGVVVLQSERKR
jgi:4-amino-4-deoxy-L-arabinose transferase-like glycosyltransferase